MPEYEYHTFPKKTMPLKELLPLLRMSGYSNRDECGSDVMICPECEDWTWVKFNLHSCLLDKLDDLIVESIDYSGGENCIMLWVQTDDFNWFKGADDNAV